MKSCANIKNVGLPILNFLRLHYSFLSAIMDKVRTFDTGAHLVTQSQYASEYLINSNTNFIF